MNEIRQNRRDQVWQVENSRAGKRTKQEILSQIKEDLGSGYVRGGQARVWFDESYKIG
jgi:hypothetical protein